MRFQRKRVKGWKKPDNCIYIGRPSMWGNPFTMKSDNIYVDFNYPNNHLIWVQCAHPDSGKHIDLFREMLFDLDAHDFGSDVREHFKMMQLFIKDLDDKNIMCWCNQKTPCHGDVLMHYLAHVKSIEALTERTIDDFKHSKEEWRLIKHTDVYIRDSEGLICLFPKITKYDGQEERFIQESEMHRANAKLIQHAPKLLEALIEISKGEGRFSRDPLTHANNCIEDMKNIALKVINSLYK